jgi:hypothetical protein
MKNANSVCGLFAICCIFSCGAVDVYTDITNGSKFNVYLTVKPNSEQLLPIGKTLSLVNCGTVSYRFDKPGRVQVEISRHDYRNEYVFSNAQPIDVYIINTTGSDVTLELAAGYMEAMKADDIARIPEKKVDQFTVSSEEMGKSKYGEIFTSSPLFSAFTADSVPRVVEYAILDTVMTVVIL